MSLVRVCVFVSSAYRWFSDMCVFACAHTSQSGLSKSVRAPSAGRRCRRPTRSPRLFEMAGQPSCRRFSKSSRGFRSDRCRLSRTKSNSCIYDSVNLWSAVSGQRVYATHDVMLAVGSWNCCCRSKPLREGRVQVYLPEILSTMQMCRAGPGRGSRWFGFSRCYNSVLVVIFPIAAVKRERSTQQTAAGGKAKF